MKTNKDVEEFVKKERLLGIYSHNKRVWRTCMRMCSPQFEKQSSTNRLTRLDKNIKRKLVPFIILLTINI